jgi:hypothetical protein
MNTVPLKKYRRILPKMAFMVDGLSGDGKGFVRFVNEVTAWLSRILTTIEL